MPHVTLEYSANLAVAPDALRVLLRRIHDALVALGVGIDQLKSRAIRCDTYVVADGRPERAFAHLTLAVMGSRDEAQKAEMGRAALALVVEALHGPAAGLACDCTVDVRDLRPATYLKTVLAPPSVSDRSA